jgi:hypothetical protein
MMSKAGVASAQAPGTAIPTPEGYVYQTIPSLVADLTVSPTHLRLAHSLLPPTTPLLPLPRPHTSTLLLDNLRK